MMNRHLASVVLNGFPNLYLTARDSGCITMEGKPSIMWSVSVQESGVIVHEQPIDESFAQALYTAAHDPELRFSDFLEDCREMVLAVKRTDSVVEVMRMVFAHHMMDS